MAAVNGTDSRVHAYLNGTLFSCGKATTLNRYGEQHSINMLQIFSPTFLPNIVKSGQHLANLFPKLEGAQRVHMSTK